MPESVQVVIAKYREDVSWAERLGLSYIVYDKSSEPLTDARRLPNIGREAHTYLTHIVEQWESLAGHTAFVQGNPFDHLNDHGKADVQELRSMIMDCVERNVPFRGFAWFRLRCDGLGRPHDLGNPENRGRWPGWGKDIPVAEVFSRLFAAEPPREFIARAATGLFCVSAERIRTRPREFYEYALRLVAEDPRDTENTGHALERLWQLVFNGNRAWNKDKYF
ncbi:DUF3431 domain-containing protein [Salidesulfovibrio onnuriiensis]|uniref:DUF3431 domain-containing protein n=1 Tax=Salidesulfovibrio onnuriiensis TaxID=2583823 RepID=UPI0011C90A37|nr:DUF3431 domain-containing protein [Salidesulfovibrio onnuriiensis]